MIAKGNAPSYAQQLTVHGTLLGCFARAIDLAAAIECPVNIETQFGELPVHCTQSLADLVDNYDALRDSATDQ